MSGGAPGPQLVTRSENVDPFTINIQTSRKNTSTSSRVTAKVDVTLNERAPSDSADATLTIEPYLTMDDDIKRDSQSVLELEDIRLDGIDAESDNNRINITIRKGAMTTVEVTSEEFQRDFFAGLDVDVKVEGFEVESVVSEAAD